MAAALALGLGGMAQAATVYNLGTPPGCSTCGSGPFGTVTVTPEAGGDTLHVSISLDPGVYFNQAGAAFEAVAFSLLGDAAATIQNISDTADFSIAGLTENVENKFHQDGAGSFDYGINWIGTGNNSSLGVQTLSFDIVGSSMLSLDASDMGALFGVDVAITNPPGSLDAPATGIVSALPGGVPEPATWALLIMGVGLAGSALRRRARSEPVFA
jgi:hypothetical protein